MQKNLRFDTKYLEGFLSEKDFEDIFPEVEKAHELLVNKSGPGSEYLGWQDLPNLIGDDQIKEIEETAKDVMSRSDALIVIGIGGSYLGSRSAIEMLKPDFSKRIVFFAGYNLSGEYFKELLDELRNRDVSVNIISKSGTTTEPAIAFRIVEEFLREKYSDDEIKDRIICTTDKHKGALRETVDKKGYKSFVIPDDVGGRFSVLTPVGLFPIACAGVNIRAVVDGARAQLSVSSECKLDKNMPYRYAAMRNLLYRRGKRIEILSSFDRKLHFLDEWWKQLFGESEGKGGHGIFPASCDFSTDLHSIGQLIQDGERNLFETFLVSEADAGRLIPSVDENIDNLNYLAGKSVDYVNSKAYEATAEAHFEGGVPSSTIFIPKRSAFCLGELFYFFEKAVSISAYIAGVNPFNQPGVDAYKKKMFKLLGKPDA